MNKRIGYTRLIEHISKKNWVDATEVFRSLLEQKVALRLEAEKKELLTEPEDKEDDDEEEKIDEDSTKTGGSPTKTRTSTATSTVANPLGNVTVTGGAGDGDTTVHVHMPEKPPKGGKTDIKENDEGFGGLPTLTKCKKCGKTDVVKGDGAQICDKCYIKSINEDSPGQGWPTKEDAEAAAKKVREYDDREITVVKDGKWFRLHRGPELEEAFGERGRDRDDQDKCQSCGKTGLTLNDDGLCHECWADKKSAKTEDVMRKRLAFAEDRGSGSDPFKYECGNCDKKFKSQSMDPKCPECGKKDYVVPAEGEGSYQK